MIDFQNKPIFKLKESPGYAKSVEDLLIPDEQVIDAYQAGRDGVVFTDRRIVVVNVQGLTGKKRDYTSIPYSRIQAYSIETAGTFDMDAELDVHLSGLGRLRFEFRARSRIMEISKHISAGVL
ncbi:MAG TPA: PH domain-containing protein [Longimicrobiales bacterium]|nr:PH domain-containing protein [Longimicrobiales bacterium]